jgi:OOP family OmpA-OmpF porin
MKYLRSIVAISVLMSAGIAVSTAAAAEGWYAVASGGQSSVNVNKDALDELVIDSFWEEGIEVLDGESSLDDSGGVWSMALGYAVSPRFAAELAYVDLGRISYDAAGTVSDGEDAVDLELTARVKVRGPVLSFLGILPIGEKASIFGRAGIAAMQSKWRATASDGEESLSVAESTQRTNGVFGIGGEFNVNARLGVRLEWNRYLKVGTSSENSDFDAFVAGIRFSF